MPEFQAPGVYVEEISTGPKSIEGVATSTVGMLGLTERGPVGPRLVVGMKEFQRYYGGYLKDSYLPNAVEGFFANGGGRCFIARIISKDASVSRIDYEGMSVRAAGPGIWGSRVAFLVLNTGVDATANSHASETNSQTFKMIVACWKDPLPKKIKDLQLTNDADPKQTKKGKGAIQEYLDQAEAVEIHDNLSISSSDSNYFGEIINSQSCLIKLTKTTDSDDNEKPVDTLPARPKNTAKFIFLTNAKPADPDIVLNDFLGDLTSVSGKKTGLEAFKEIDEIKIVYCPDVHMTPPVLAKTIDKAALRKAIVGHCETMKNRFAILDCSQGEAVVSSIKPPIDSTFAAFYYPWIKTDNPLLKDRKLVPPGGFIAGIYARTDNERGVHKAPANEIINGALGLEFPILEQQQAILNLRGVNVIREFPGRGIRVWGARTSSSDAEWKYINVRRLFLYIEESIQKGTQWVVFEPDNVQLWDLVKQSITSFLTMIWRTGALMGATSDQAFFVKIDRTTMTQADLDNGNLICLIGIAPIKPAEFIIFRISQKTR